MPNLITSDIRGAATGAGPGRPKGSLNKVTGVLREAILLAAERAGGDSGLVGYLTTQAEMNPGPFLALLGKVLPLKVGADEGAPTKMVITWDTTSGSVG